MPGRGKPLITRNGIPDPQAYNPQTGQWESFIGVSWGKTAGGLYVPIRVDDQGRQEVTLSGTIVNVASFTRPALAVNAQGQLVVDIDVEGYTRLVVGISSTSIPDKANIIVSWESDSPHGGVGTEKKEASFSSYGGIGGAVFEFPLSTSRVKRVVLENKSTVAWSDINISIWKAR